MAIAKAIAHNGLVLYKIQNPMLIKKLLAFTIGLTVAATGTVLPAQAQTDEEMDALIHNIMELCEKSFDDLEEMGLYLNDEEEDALDFACDVVVDGVDDEEVSDEYFVAAIELLEDILVEVTYEE
ncbi:hypothetical protein VB712_17460 [Spirulina sp. CCNP1310]|uniref:hypothetical protein n=1 Tax=Spirulina sp. CCNP1310 TaxID=3110249 RepID=UPI002B1EC10A|nr:hypothetical protein [Spirulina sp. CCNP1310]MEA5421016.1 hypothetical protein [Spirulina sp. CCNP1310]